MNFLKPFPLFFAVRAFDEERDDLSGSEGRFFLSSIMSEYFLLAAVFLAEEVLLNSSPEEDLFLAEVPDDWARDADPERPAAPERDEEALRGARSVVFDDSLASCGLLSDVLRGLEDESDELRYL